MLSPAAAGGLGAGLCFGIKVIADSAFVTKVWPAVLVIAAFTALVAVVFHFSRFGGQYKYDKVPAADALQKQGQTLVCMRDANLKFFADDLLERGNPFCGPKRNNIDSLIGSERAFLKKALGDTPLHCYEALEKHSQDCAVPDF